MFGEFAENEILVVTIVCYQVMLSLIMSSVGDIQVMVKAITMFSQVVMSVNKSVSD